MCWKTAKVLQLYATLRASIGKRATTVVEEKGLYFSLTQAFEKNALLDLLPLRLGCKKLHQSGKYR